MKENRSEAESSVTRRAVLGTAATLPVWVFALGPAGAIVRMAVQDETDWKPLLFTREQARAVGLLAEAILPRTETPGALDARVHEFIDLELSLADGTEQSEFLERLSSIEARCQEQFGKRVGQVSDLKRAELLDAISDHNEVDADHVADQAAEGLACFADLKRRTVFAYYTSEVGRVEGLGLPDAVTMEKFRGCTHRDGSHA